MKDPVVFFAWQSPAEEKCVRGRTWWMVAALIAVALFGYALLTANFAFAVMLVMFGVIMMIAKTHNEPIDVVIADQGLVIGPTVYDYGNIKEYTIIEEQGLIYFYLNGILSAHAHVRIPDDIEYQDLRTVLRGRIVENPDRTAAPMIDAIAKKLKIF